MARMPTQLITGLQIDLKAVDTALLRAHRNGNRSAANRLTVMRLLTELRAIYSQEILDAVRSSDTKRTG